ncbi:hypothetical protein BRAS3843_760016 [Bradyrhizobium sp. STM 3843]|nr:hypothetical protein BRAS3843_760016 [Bradyrhizobium sp. STM 3843]
MRYELADAQGTVRLTM